MIGAVRMFDAKRGFGFLRPEGAGGKDDVFVHVSELQKTGIATPPVQGQRFSFEIEQSDRGPRAVKLALV